jgi:hypothetical protein
VDVRVEVMAHCTFQFVADQLVTSLIEQKVSIPGTENDTARIQLRNIENSGSSFVLNHTLQSEHVETGTILRAERIAD